ncbi:ribonuclease P protein component [Mycoplasmatota bacterium]|nr:ribonuclease P protein component [Mycoplasmatota bacterium]
MKKKYIIKKNYYIHKIILDKRSVANKYFIVYKKQNNMEHFRFVVSIGKKIGNAVVRNKIKRQIKDIIYQKKSEIIENYDILIIVRPSVNNLKYLEIQKQLLNVFSKSKLIKE